jgi:AcrR family transcriptional regulator
VQDRLEIPGESDDLRARRTRDQLAWALIALMHEKAYDEISVQDIAERADVGRSTFYAHFQDKDEMFVRHNVVFGRAMGERLAWDENTKSWGFPIRHIFDHVRHMRPVYESLVRCRKLDLLLRVWQLNMAEVFEQRIAAARNGTAGTIPAAILAQHFAATIVMLLLWWVDHHFPADASRMEEHFRRLTAGLR